MTSCFSSSSLVRRNVTFICDRLPGSAVPDSSCVAVVKVRLGAVGGVVSMVTETSLLAARVFPAVSVAVAVKS